QAGLLREDLTEAGRELAELRQLSRTAFEQMGGAAHAQAQAWKEELAAEHQRLRGGLEEAAQGLAQLRQLSQATVERLAQEAQARGHTARVEMEAAGQQASE